MPLVGWVVGWLVGWSAGWLVGWFVVRLVPWLVTPHTRPSAWLVAWPTPPAPLRALCSAAQAVTRVASTLSSQRRAQLLLRLLPHLLWPQQQTWPPAQHRAWLPQRTSKHAPFNTPSHRPICQIPAKSAYCSLAGFGLVCYHARPSPASPRPVPSSPPQSSSRLPSLPSTTQPTTQTITHHRPPTTDRAKGTKQTNCTYVMGWIGVLVGWPADWRWVGEVDGLAGWRADWLVGWRADSSACWWIDGLMGWRAAT